MAAPLYEALGAELDVAKRAVPKPPGLIQRKANPALMDAFTAAQGRVADLQSQYEGALGSPGPARLGATPNLAPGVMGPALPALQTSGFGATAASRARDFADTMAPASPEMAAAVERGVQQATVGQTNVRPGAGMGVWGTNGSGVAATASPQYNLPTNQTTTVMNDANSITVNGNRIMDAPRSQAAAAAPGLGAAPVRMVSALQHDAILDGAPRRADFGLPDRGTRYTPTTPAGAFFQGGMGIRRIAGDNALSAAYAKIGADYAARRETNAVTREGNQLSSGASIYGHNVSAANNAANVNRDMVLKGPGAVKDAADANNVNMRNQAAQAYLRANPGDYAGAAGIASGRPLPTDKFGAIPSTTGNDLITFDKSGKLPPRIQTPMRPVSAAHIDAALAGSMKGKTRAQVIQAYKDKGYDVSGIK